MFYLYIWLALCIGAAVGFTTAALFHVNHDEDKSE